MDIKIDKNYNFIEEKGLYHDNLTEAVTLISKAQAESLISDTEASLILKMVIKKEFREEVKSVVPLTKQAPEILSLFRHNTQKSWLEMAIPPLWYIARSANF